MPNLISLKQIRSDELSNAINTPIAAATGTLYSFITGQQITTGLLDARFVHNTGNENISGVKTFFSRPIVFGTGVVLSGEAYPAFTNPSGFTNVRVTGSANILTPNFTGVGGAQVILSGNGFILISGGAASGPGSSAGVTSIIATGAINTGFFTGDVRLSGAGNITTFTGNNASRLIIISGNTGAYANFITPSQTGLFSSTQVTGSPALPVADLTGAGTVTVTTGGGTLVIFSGNTNFGVTRLTTTGAFPSGVTSGNVTISGVNGISVTTGENGNIVISGSASASNTGELTGVFYPLVGNPAGYISNTGLITGVITGIRQDLNFFAPFLITGVAVQEALVSRNYTVTGWAIACVDTGRGGAHLVSGGSGAILQYPMSGRFYQRATGGSTSLIRNFSFASGLLYKEEFGLNITVTGRNRVGYDLSSGLSGIANVTLAVFGFYP